MNAGFFHDRTTPNISLTTDYHVCKYDVMQKHVHSLVLSLFCRPFQAITEHRYAQLK